jgi:epidermal growth factor receptor substrate 15
VVVLCRNHRVARSYHGTSPAGTADDFFADDSAEASKLTESSARLGNLKNQVASTERSVSALQTQRVGLERSTADGASQISELQTKLSQSKAAHETESRHVAELVERQKEQQATLLSLREQFIHAESDLSALRQERGEVEQALLRDKEEVRTMKAKMKEAADETANLKAQLDKLKKEARQQKGLVAISKKQLAAAEGERDRTAAALTETGESRGEEAIEGVEHPSRPPTAAGVSLPTSPPTVSPAPSTKSTNPFDRLGRGATMSPQTTGGGPTIPSGTETGENLAAAAEETITPSVSAAVSSPASSSTVARAENPFGASTEEDPFGSSSGPPIRGPNASSSDFEDALRVPATASHLPTTAKFDDDFSLGFGSSSFAPPTSTPQNHGSDFDDAFKELESAPANAIASQETKPDVGNEAAAALAATESLSRQAEDSESSDDDEEGPEEPEAAIPDRREPPVSDPLADAARAGSVSSLTSFEKSTAQKFPELDQQPPAEPLSSENVVAGPSSTKSSDNEMFQDAATSYPVSPSTIGPGHGESGAGTAARAAAPIGGSRASDTGTEEFVKVGEMPDVPTPASSASLSAPVSAPAVTAFDSAFDSPFSAPSHPQSASVSPAPPVSAVIAPSAAVPTSQNTFDDAFDDLPAAQVVVPKGESGGERAGSDGFGDTADFDDDFTFEPGFGDAVLSSAPNGSSAVAAATKEEGGGSLSAFDAAFSSFDSPAIGGAQAATDPFGADTGFGDSFSSAPTPSQPRSHPAPQLPPRKDRQPTPAASDDSEEVKQVRRYLQSEFLYFN